MIHGVMIPEVLIPQIKSSSLLGMDFPSRKWIRKAKETKLPIVIRISGPLNCTTFSIK